MINVQETDDNNKTNLSTFYTFDNFVLCDGNMLAYSAAKEVVTGARIFNPICIIGKNGNGKTHLIQAIGNAIVEHDPDKRVLYATTEEFVNDVIHAIRDGKLSNMDMLREKYRNVDVLLLDDIQFVEGKEASSSEMAHCIDFLYRAGKLIILTSEKPLKEIDKLNIHIRTIVESGLVVEIKAPDKAMRECVIRAKARENGLLLSDEVIDYIASNCDSNISEINGAITSIVAYSDLSRTLITLDTTKNVLKGLFSENNNRSTKK